jgi:hypothetical protein
MILLTAKLATMKVGTHFDMVVENTDIFKAATIFEDSPHIESFKVTVGGTEACQEAFGFGGFNKWVLTKKE